MLLENSRLLARIRLGGKRSYIGTSYVKRLRQHAPPLRYVAVNCFALALLNCMKVGLTIPLAKSCTSMHIGAPGAGASPQPRGQGGAGVLGGGPAAHLAGTKRQPALAGAIGHQRKRPGMQLPVWGFC